MPPRPHSSERNTRVGFGILALLLAIALIAAAFQTNQVDELSGQVAGLQTELSSTQAALNRYESRFSEIRSSVAELRAQFGELETLVEEQPPSTP